MIEQSSYKKLRVFGRLILGKAGNLQAQKANGRFATQTKASRFTAINNGVGEILLAASTLTAEDSGKTLLLGHATGFTTTLPVLADSIGFKCKFIVSVAPTSGNDVLLAADTDLISGILDDAEAATVAESVILADQINIVASSALVGTWVTLENPAGTAWYVNGFSTLAASITATVPTSPSAA